MKLRGYIAALHAALFAILLAVSPALAGSMTLMGAGKVGAAAVPFALDGTPACVNGTSAALAVGTLTTTFPNDVIYAGVTTNGGPVISITGVAGVTFTLRAKFTNGAQTDELWSGTAASPLSGVTATVNTTSSSFNSSCLYAFSGSHIASPYDPNVAIPNGSVGGTACSYTTTNANDILIGSTRTSGTTAASTGFTTIPNSGANFHTDQYKSVSSTQSAFAAPNTGDGSAVFVCDAIIQGP
jgi:hypothetical protein